MVIESNEPYRLPIRFFNETIIPTGSTALTFAEKFGGMGAEKLLLTAWVKKDPTMERFLIEWRKKIAEF